MPATVIAERIGRQRGITILKSASSSRDRARQLNALLIWGALAQSQVSPSLNARGFPAWIAGQEFRGPSTFGLLSVRYLRDVQCLIS